MYSLEQIQKIFEEELKNNVPDREPATLFVPVKYLLSSGGKRLRPALVYMAANLFSDEIAEATPAALAIETFHNFTLMHDDIMDQAEVRRGIPTVHKKWGENRAILSGDAMAIMAYKYFDHYPPGVLKSLLEVFNQTAMEVCQGQQYDMDFEQMEDVTEEDYIIMIAMKTSVLIAASLKMGAIIGGAPASEADKLYYFGKSIGIAFQLQDDLLDVFGDPGIFGKKNGGDILANKKTFLIIKARQVAGQDHKNQLNELFSDKGYDPEEKIQKVTAIFKSLAIEEKTRFKIDEYFSSAIHYLKNINLPEERKKELYSLSDKLIKRVK